MAFIVKKKVHGRNYYYLNKSVREGDKVKTKTVAYLGKDKKEAEEKAKEILEGVRRDNAQSNSAAAVRDKTAEEQKPQTLPATLTIDDITSFCKRRGFIFQDSEIYGGMSGCWDFGPIGTELFNNIKASWWKHFIQNRDDMFGIDASIISHQRTWKASGHITSFNDIAIKCKKCKKTNKIDKADLGKVKCEYCNGELDESTAKEINLMFPVHVGQDGTTAYLRGETAQGMFMDFKLIAETSRAKVPFGIAQVGKCFRNEISPRDFLFRSREFTIGEFEYFIHPEQKTCALLDKEHKNVNLLLLTAETQEKEQGTLTETTIGKMVEEKRMDEWHGYWLAEQILWFKSIGINMNRLKIREHKKSELSHYSSATFDLDYEYPFGSKEVAGNANRGQYDLNQHIKESKQNLEIYDEETKSRIIPRVIEPTFGMERVFLMVLTDAYNYDKQRENIVLKLNPKLAPYSIGVFPLVNKLEEKAREIFNTLKNDFHAFYDTSGSIGRRYARQDEIGTPYCITIDFDTLKDNSVTVRNRDDTKQIRVKIPELKEIIRKLLNKEIAFEKAGKMIR